MSFSKIFRDRSLLSSNRRRRARSVGVTGPRPLRAESLEPRRLLAADPIVQNAMGELILDDGDPQPDPITLLHDPGVQDGVFFDEDPGDALTLTVENNTNDDLFAAAIVNDELVVTYDPYAAAQDRTPAQITVRATDPSNAFVEDTLSVTVSPVTTVEFDVVVRRQPTPESEFTFFAATPSPGADPLGVGRFQLVGDSLIYELDDLVGVDLDGTETPGDPSDDVTDISFRDNSNSNALAFDVRADDDLFLDKAADRVTGTWESGAEGLGNFLTQLYDGDLFVRLTTQGNPTAKKIGASNIDVSAELAVLPESLTSVGLGETYIVEVWVKDTFSGSTGLANVFVDLHFDPQLSSGDPNTIGTGDPFDLFSGDADVDNNSGVANLGGSTVFAKVGLDPAYARVGYVEFTADEVGQQAYTLDVTTLDRRGGTFIDASQMDVHNANVMQAVDERDMIGVHRGRNFYLDANGNGQWDGRGAGGDTAYRFGHVGDKPLVGDWNGDGYDNLGVFRPGNLAFYLDLNGNNHWDGPFGGDVKFRIGGHAEDTQIAGDFDGDGVDEIGWHRGRLFRVDLNGNYTWDKVGGGDMVYAFGEDGDLPVIGDWDNDGTDEVGVYRPSNQKFYVDSNGSGAWEAGSDAAFRFRSATETPLAGDWFGNGTDEIATYLNRGFYLDLNGNGQYNVPPGGDIKFVFGFPDITPVAGAWQPPVPLLTAAEAAPLDGQVPGSEALTDDALAPVFQHAIDIWSAGPLTADQEWTLGQLDVRIADLPGNALGQAQGTAITFDVDAAGWGWFTDTTAGDNAMLGDRQSMDLLTAALHEIGHVLGLDDVDGDSDSVMSESLEPGIRRGLTDAERDHLFAEL